MTSRTIKNLKLIVDNGSLLIRENGQETKILRFENNVLKIHGKIISWSHLQDLLTNGNFRLITNHGDEHIFSIKGGVRPGSGRKKIEDDEKKKIHSFSLSPGAALFLDKFASCKGVSKSEIIENLIKDGAKANGFSIV